MTAQIIEFVARIDEPEPQPEPRPRKTLDDAPGFVGELRDMVKELQDRLERAERRIRALEREGRP